MPRPQVMRHMIAGENLALAVCRQQSIQGAWQHVGVADSIIESSFISNKTAEINSLFPLYLYNPPIDWDTQLLGTGANDRRANLAPSFVARLGTLLKLQWQSDGRGDGCARFGPEDVLAYIYAVFHAPSYRSRYAELLKIDFPRVPLTSDATLFWKLVKQGRQLIGLHLLDGARSDGASTPRGEIGAGYPKYQDGKVVINKAGEGFEGVDEEVWNFHIGGYQVAHKWLKDRKGRTLSAAAAAHYRKILAALERTRTAMHAVDEIIEEHGGWPLPGSQGESTFGDADIKSFFGARGAAAAKPRPVKAKTKTKAAPPKTPRRARSKASPAPAAARPIQEYSRDELIIVLKKVVKHKWVLREDAIREGARVLGFARTGRNIEAAFKSAITGAIRRGFIEYNGDQIRRS